MHSLLFFLWYSIIILNAKLQLPTTKDCQYVAWTDINDKGGVKGRLSYGQSTSDACYLKWKWGNFSHSERAECNENNTWTEYYYHNIFCEGEPFDSFEINDDDTYQNDDDGSSRVWEVHCDNNAVDCASYAYIYDVDSCDYGVIPLNEQLSAASMVSVWSYQFGIYGFCGKFYSGPYAPSLDEDGAYFTLHSCEDKEVKTKQWSAQKDGIFEEKECGDHEDHIGFIEFDFIDGICMTKTEYLNSSLGEIAIDFNIGPIEKEFIQIYVHCPTFIEAKDKDEPSSTTSIMWIVVIVSVIISFICVILIFVLCTNGRKGNPDQKQKYHHTRVNTETMELEDMEQEPDRSSLKDVWF